jgi:RNA polymerase sigma-70 factor, ECF subfamily
MISDSVSTPFMRTDLACEESWLASARQGDSRALEQLYEAYRRPIYALCFRLVGRREDAEDAMQAAFAQAFRSLGRFRGECALRTWIYRIAVNEATALLRGRSRTCAEIDLGDSGPDATEEAVRSLAVMAALEGIPPEQRAVLVLRYWEDLGYEEIAAVLRISLPAVKMRLSRAKAAFRKQYGDDL